MKKTPHGKPEKLLEAVEASATVTIEERTVHIPVWLFPVKGLTGFRVPAYLLHTNLPENSPWERTLTDHLYGGDEHYRICQEAVLLLGGVEVLRTLKHNDLGNYHMNEGHSAFLALALLESQLGSAELIHAPRQSRLSLADGEVSRKHLRALNEQNLWRSAIRVMRAHACRTLMRVGPRDSRR